MHPQAVREWRRIYLKLGIDGLRSRSHPGRPALLNDEQKQELLRLLADEPMNHGFERHVWSTAMIAELIRRKFGVDYNHDWVREMLHGLGMSWQKPMRRARERDEARIAAWQSEDWPELLKNTVENGVILFADEVGFLMNRVYRAIVANLA